jgi:hypothetical protein
MKCNYKLTAKCTDGSNYFVCQNECCGHDRCSNYDNPKLLHRECGKARTSAADLLPVPEHGPGRELHELLEQLGFNIGGCNCQEWIDRMNRWGVDGCREHRAEIIAHLEEEKDSATLTEKLKAGVLAIANGLPLTIGGLVDEAIRRAEVRA